METGIPGLNELRLLSTLIKVCGQYMSAEPTYLDHDCLSAGEHAVALLGEYGLLIPEGRGGYWTTRAKFLEGAQDISSGDYAAILAQYMALPDREPFSPRPGYRSNQPDFQLGCLRLWVPARAISKFSAMPWWRGPKPSSDRLDVEIRLEPVGAQAIIRGELLAVSEVRSFRNELQRLYETSEGGAELVAYKNTLELKLQATRGDELIGAVTVSNPMYDNSLRSDLRLQSGHLPRAIAGLDRVLETFQSLNSDVPPDM